jgi:transcriptional regulator with XRE-family HTH domain
MRLVNLAIFKEYRANAGLSQNKLGRIAGISEGTVSHIERTGRAREGTLKKIADALSVKVTDLIGDDHHPLPTKPVHNPEITSLWGDRANRAHLEDREYDETRQTIKRVIDIMTIKNPVERKRYATVLVNTVRDYHLAVFQPGGRGDASSSLGGDDEGEELKICKKCGGRITG